MSFDNFELTALHDLVAISGSLVLGLAVALGDLEAEEGFAISRLDEHWQAALWGRDEEAEAAARRETEEETGLRVVIDADLGGYDKMRTDFIQAGVTQFGSGWCWIAKKDGKLAIMKTPNGENPLMHGASPILGCDVWEHSYYIDYRNLRPKYLEAFVDSLVNWDYVDEMFSKA